MAVNKVQKNNGDVIIDLTSDTVTSSDHIMKGYVGHLADGSVVTGTGSGGSGSDYYMWQDSDGYLHYSNSALGASGYVITASTEYQEVSSGTTIIETVTTTASNAIENAMGVTVYDKAWVIYDNLTDADNYYDANAFPLVAGDTYKVTIGSDVYTSTAWMDSTYMGQVVIGCDVIGWDGVTTLVCPIEAWGNNETGRNRGGIYSTASITAGTTIKIEHLT